MKYVHIFFADTIYYLPTIGGKTIIMYQNYTFSFVNNKRYLRCSRMFRGKCEARLILDEDGNIVSAKTSHNHPPPSYYRTPSGLYIKINS